MAAILFRYGRNRKSREKRGQVADTTRAFDLGTKVPLCLPLLLGNLAPARWVLLEGLKRHGPLSINELARRLKRDYENVHTDVSRLIELGLVDRGVQSFPGVLA